MVGSISNRTHYLLSMISINSTEFFVLALTVAMAVIALMCGQRHPGEATTCIVAMMLNESVTTDDHLVVLKTLDDGELLILRNGLPLFDGDTVNIVATAVGNKLSIVEKRGLGSSSGLEKKFDGTAGLEKLPTRFYHVRYDSEITGEWALFSFSNRSGNTVSTHLKY